MLTTQYLESLTDIKLGTLVYHKPSMTPIDFEVNRSKVKLDMGIYLPFNILRILCSTDTKLGTIVNPKE
jgi:hypothetical protein